MSIAGPMSVVVRTAKRVVDVSRHGIEVEGRVYIFLNDYQCSKSKEDFVRGVTEKIAENILIDMAPDAFKEDYASLIDANFHTEEEAFIVKAADVICAYIKTLEELSAGNREFELAKKRLDRILKDYHSEEVDYFMQAFIPSFSLSLDEITQEDH